MTPTMWKGSGERQVDEEILQWIQLSIKYQNYNVRTEADEEEHSGGHSTNSGGNEEGGTHKTESEKKLVVYSYAVQMPWNTYQNAIRQPPNIHKKIIVNNHLVYTTIPPV